MTGPQPPLERLLKVWRSARAEAAHQRRMLKEHWPSLYQALNAVETADDVALALHEPRAGERREADRREQDRRLHQLERAVLMTAMGWRMNVEEHTDGLWDATGLYLQAMGVIPPEEG